MRATPRKKFLFIPLAGLGYLFPAIRLAQILEKRSHEVMFAATVDFELTLQSCGLPVTGIRNDHVPFLRMSDWFNAKNAEGEVRVLDSVIRWFRPDFIVSYPLVLSAFILSERHGIPLINIGFTEYLYPGTGPYDEHKNWRLKVITDYYNGYRTACHLPPVACSPQDSPLIGTRYLLRSVPELTDQRDLPAQVDYIGPLYWEPAYTNIGLQQFIAASKQAAKKVVYTQIGRLFEDIKLWELLMRSMGAMQTASFVIDIGRADYIRSDFAFPPNVYLNAFIPLGAIADDIACVICSAQSTTVVSAILHGKQILCLPHAADSIELSHRLEAKGLAYAIYGHENLHPEKLGAILRQFDQGALLTNVLRYQQLFEAFDDEAIYEKTTSGLI